MKSLLALFLLSGFAVAQNEDRIQDDPLDEPVDGLLERSDPGDDYEKAARVFLRGIFYGEADLDDNGGDLSIKELGIGGWHRWPLMGGNGAFGAGLQYNGRKYDFGGGATLGGVADPFDHVEDLRATGFYEALITEEWSWFAAGTLAAGADEDADLNDGFYVEGAGGFLFQVQDGMQLGLELIAFTEIEDDPSFYLFPVIEMEINEDSRISTVKNSTDPALAYFFDFSDELSTYFGAGVKIRQYALDDAVLPDDSALKDQEIALRGGLTWSRQKFTADAYVGLAFRELTLDVDDSEVDQDDIDPAPFVGATVSYGIY